MKKTYTKPSFIEVQIDVSDIICQSYGSLPVSGRTDGFDAPPARRGWDEYENYNQ